LVKWTAEDVEKFLRWLKTTTYGSEFYDKKGN
jgi:hypothetical protein